MKREATAAESNGLHAGPGSSQEKRRFAAGQVVFECKPFVAVLDRKWKFSVSRGQVVGPN